MLKKFSLENYRCFERTEIVFSELSVIVGKNNAGKSTLIEALRILSLVVSRCRSINYTSPPTWLEIDKVIGVAPSIQSLDISSDGIIFMYGDGPARIFAEFENGTKINIYINIELSVFATIFNSKGLNVESKKFAASLKLNDINILPQISPVLKDEPIIKYETVQRNLPTHLSSRNFRNQLNYYHNSFDKFKELAEQTWQGLVIDSTSQNIRTQGRLFLFIRDNRFEAEIGMMGHGLQMWLQTMWFLSRCSQSSTVILDEPDVYMHADLQRRLIRLVKSRYKQVMIATHSVEIMSEVEPDNILPIISSRPRQSYANKAPIVQKIVNEIGSVHNIEIARLFSYNKLLIVEGEKDDVKILTIFQTKIFPTSFEQFDVLPKTFVEGWGGWQRVIGSNKVFRDNKADLTAYCLFDSDYHIQEEKAERLLDAKKHGINLHIWERKEIENYLLVPSAIYRIIKSRRKTSSLTEDAVVQFIDNECESMKDDIIDSFATGIKSRDNGKSIKTANQEARKYVNTMWKDRKHWLSSGKRVIASLCNWLSDQHNISINRFSIAREINLNELSPEIVHVITCIENKADF